MQVSSIALVNRPIHTLISQPPTADEVRVLLRPSKEKLFGIGSPFGICKDGVIHVFADMCLRDRPSRKWLVRFMISADTDLIMPTKLPIPDMPEPASIEYPFLQRLGDKIFMFPQTTHSGGILVGIADNFPDKWSWEASGTYWDCESHPATPLQRPSMMRTSNDNLLIGHIDFRHELLIFRAMKAGCKVHGDDGSPAVYYRNCFELVATGDQTNLPAGTPFVLDGMMLRPSSDEYPELVSIMEFSFDDGREVNERWAGDIRAIADTPLDAGITHASVIIDKPDATLLCGYTIE
jgi:hypothetical protein